MISNFNSRNVILLNEVAALYLINSPTSKSKPTFKNGQNSAANRLTSIIIEKIYVDLCEIKSETLYKKLLCERLPHVCCYWSVISPGTIPELLTRLSFPTLY